MTCSIFIKTYATDFPWLKYCLRSIAKFCSGFSEIVLVAGYDDIKELNSWGLTRERLVGVHEKEPGYLWQQAVKMNADSMCSSDFILFVDSDCCFTRQVTPDMFFMDRKPISFKTSYVSLGDAVHWKPPTEKALGFKCDWETMRRFPLVYPRHTLAGLRAHIADQHKMSFNDYVIYSGGFSEFNALGSFILDKLPDALHWIDTERDDMPATVLVQHWSHGGLTDEIKARLEAILE